MASEILINCFQKIRRKVLDILSNYFKNEIQKVPEILSNYFKSKTHRRFPYFKNKTQDSPEILPNYFKNKTQKDSRDFFKLLQKQNISGLQDSFKLPQTQDPQGVFEILSNYVSNEKKVSEISSNYFKSNTHRRFSIFFQTT